MSKNAKTQFDIHPLLNERWSPRAFEDKAIETDKLQKIFEAARWSPSASNEQPWSFMIGLKNDETYQKIMETLVKFNQMWAINAPVLLLSIGKKTNSKEEASNIYKYDVGQSVAHLTFQASFEGLHLHQMSGFYPGKAAELFELPDNYEAISVIAMGYIGNPSMLHSRMQKAEKAERERKDLKDFIFTVKFGNQAGLI